MISHLINLLHMKSNLRIDKAYRSKVFNAVCIHTKSALEALRPVICRRKGFFGSLPKTSLGTVMTLSPFSLNNFHAYWQSIKKNLTKGAHTRHPNVLMAHPHRTTLAAYRTGGGGAQKGGRSKMYANFSASFMPPVS